MRQTDRGTRMNEREEGDHANTSFKLSGAVIHVAKQQTKYDIDYILNLLVQYINM